MSHLLPGPSDDVPPPQPLVDRRRTPDRRKTWRGGRRDSDWLNRPPGVLDKFEARRLKPRPWWSAIVGFFW